MKGTWEVTEWKINGESREQNDEARWKEAEKQSGREGLEESGRDEEVKLGGGEEGEEVKAVRGERAGDEEEKKEERISCTRKKRRRE